MTPSTFLQVIRDNARPCLLACVVVTAGGCAVQQSMPESVRLSAWESRKASLDTLDSWRLAGRMSVRLRDEAWSASLYWQQHDDSYTMQVVAPLAAGSVEITGSPGSVSMRTDDNRIFSDRDVDVLMQENLGWSVPVRAMYFWIRGLPQAGVETDSMVLDDNGRLEKISQGGWEVLYQAYTRSGEFDLPARLQIRRRGINVRLIINSWNHLNEG